MRCVSIALVFICKLFTAVVAETVRFDEECKDEFESCSQWASNGDCSKYSIWMNEFCRPSCQGCFPSATRAFRYTLPSENVKDAAPCEDEHLMCLFWKDSGYCATGFVIVRQLCRRTCQLCGQQQRLEQAQDSQALQLKRRESIFAVGNLSAQSFSSGLPTTTFVTFTAAPLTFAVEDLATRAAAQPTFFTSPPQGFVTLPLAPPGTTEEALSEWSEWAPWTACTFGRRFRTRVCGNAQTLPQPVCFGSRLNSRLCTAVENRL